MNNTRTTKRALLSSVMAVLICVAMLIGTTFAWFTDSASTAVNKIQAGTLDIGLEMKNASGNWVNAEGETLSWKKAAGAPVDEQVLWEPGCTYELPDLRLVNNGDLWLKVRVYINGIKGDAKLLEAIEFTATYETEDEQSQTLTIGTDGTITEFNDQAMFPLSTTGGNYIKIKGHMKESAGNEYRGLSIDGIGITVVATQYTYENDSTTDQYDANAVYPIVANTQAELNGAIASAQSGSAVSTEVVLPAGNFKLENGTAQNKNITISGTKDTVVTVVGDTGSQMNYQNGATLAFEGVTIQGQTAGNYGGIAHVAKTTFVNCTFNGKLTLYGDATFINCTFINKNDYAIWTWGAKNAEFIGCTFDSGGKALLLYGGAGSTETPTTNLTVTDCVFNDDNTLDTDKAAIEIGNDYNAVYNLTVNNNITVNGFAVNPAGISTGSNIWANKNSMDQAHLNVVINGVDVY